MTILITGAAGFIGSHVTKRLLDEGRDVIGIDNLNPYYDVALKEARIRQIQHNNFRFITIGLESRDEFLALVNCYKPRTMIHLAAQAGVRYSLINPYAYVDANITGFMNVLEACRQNQVDHLIYASSSSVYGANTKMPFSVHDRVDQPLSLYAATKKANELMAHSYSHMYGLATTGLRLFTVYGPWGRPDMAYFSFVKAILNGGHLKIFNHGRMKRDFTYIDDIVEGIVRLIAKKPKAPYTIYNIGSNAPVELMKFITAIETKLGMEAKKTFLPMQDGDVLETYADVEDLVRDIGFKPSTPLDVGIGRFIDWYLDYYQ